MAKDNYGNSSSGTFTGTSETEWLLEDDKRKMTASPENTLPKYYFPKRFYMLILGTLGLTLCYILRVIVSVTVIPMSAEYHWGDTYKGFVLSGFFMGYLVLQMPATYFCNRFGGKRVMFTGITFSLAMTALAPLAAQNKVAIMICRVMTGISQSIAFPTMNWLIKRWFPTSQRSSSASLIWSGVYIGIIIGNVTTPVIVSEVNWQAAFYIFSGLGLLWSLAWLLLIKDEPKNVWGIHPAELLLIEQDINPDKQHLVLNNPVYSSMSTKSDELGFFEVSRRLFRDRAIYVIIFFSITTQWGNYLLLMWYPTWLKNQANIPVGPLMSLFTALPYAFSFAFANISGVVTDRLLARGYKKIYLRKFFGVLAALVPGVCMLLMNYLPMAATLKLVVMTTSISCGGFNTQSNQIATFDIAPNSAIVTMGITNFFATIPGILGPLLAGVMLTAFNGSWGPIFLISSVCYLAGGLVWLLFAKTDKVV
ncbi:hypothetical protein SAMD00019534_123740 [Acytostelium subglobosum LB1]|uniref:hypothetical protein n=1 Tax=Acytostelium subglobosum LB1 TaxID=1410327 RepID=UPI00064516D1|nr:hypothetical protein SAMD00019534_123740 [Acytostelium subglobosum LB1]GAM29198.1 hypothetical protein SAMD00019534_123740 [Acytostelium subglobosum LB1]|eukprot:XP_012747889.1 hypothetical protein SAMD00019534_123740 [Acytostelium subglobosum LB1]